MVNTFNENLPQDFSSFLQKSEVFLSYSSKDKMLAQSLRTSLKQVGINVWRDEDRLKGGTRFSLQIEQAIRRSDAVLVLVSKAAVESDWVRNEILFAMDAKKFIIPLLIEKDTSIPIEIIGLQHICMYSNWDIGLKKITECLRNIISSKITEDTYNSKQKTISQLNSTKNPFLYGNAIPPKMFVGRNQALNIIRERVGNYYSLQSLSIIANRRMGKTSLLNYIWQEYKHVFSHENQYITVFIDAMDASTHTIEGFMSTLRRRLKRQLGNEIWQEKYDGKLTILSEAFERLSEDKGIRLILLLDEWESIMAYSELDPLLDTLRAIGSQGWVGMITATTHLLADLEKQGGLASNFYNIFGNACYLGNMPRSEWEELLDRGFKLSGRTLDRKYYNLANELAGGHPYLTQLVGSLLWKAERNRWSIEYVRKLFIDEAQMIFSLIWQRLSMEQIQAIKSILELKYDASFSEQIFIDLRLRGVLDESNDVFCKPFSDFIFKKLRTV